MTLSPLAPAIRPSKPMRFHWSLSQVGDPFRRAAATRDMSGRIDLQCKIDFCQRAEQCGIDSVLMAIGFTRPDPMLLSVALGKETNTLKFMVACRAGLLSPTMFVQQINTVSSLLNGRVHINMVCGHTPGELRYYGDFLDHDARYERTDEFLTVCRSFWADAGDVDFDGTYYQIKGGRLHTRFSPDPARGPEVYVGGNSGPAAALAAKHAHCWWRLAEPPARVAASVGVVLDSGCEVGLLVSLIARPTHEEARRAASALIGKFGDDAREVHRRFARGSDSVGFVSTYEAATADQEWLTPYLWTGAVPFLGAPAIALVGSNEEIAQALLDYNRIGVTQFLFTGWPDLDEMTSFSRHVLPRVRELEGRDGDEH